METAETSFEKTMVEVLLNLEEIKKSVEIYKTNFQSDKNNWGYAGSLKHVNELLLETLNFIK